MTSTSAEILAIGSEILSGDVLDTNSHWLCQQLAVRGIRTTRITTLPDNPEIIGETLRAAVKRHPSLLLLSGGLGPTADDLTLASVAAALGLAVETDPVAVSMVAAFYRALHLSGAAASPLLTPERAKMADLPAGSAPLANSVGAAPGVLIRHDGVAIACLPGVPSELRAIFAKSLWPRLEPDFGGQYYAERTVPTDCQDESMMAPAVDGVSRAHTEVYVKSRAQAYGSGEAIFVTLAARAVTAELVNERLSSATADLRRRLDALGISVLG